ncbi:MAG: hypothetical protein M1834_002758 [Cirrosporium novae-zelandiae]|nr:MAG: hypothetical protein M1834_002758 [Cirrosporium novae-zelandiae]
MFAKSGRRYGRSSTCTDWWYNTVSHSQFYQVVLFNNGILPHRDRSTYDPTLTSAVSYTVASAGAAPSSLTFGKEFMEIAGTYDGNVTIGFNRRLNNISNSIAAAKVAVEDIPSLFAIELGNEPDLYSGTDPIAVNDTWNVTLDQKSQILWQKTVGSELGLTNFIEAGVYLQPPKWSTALLAPLEVSNDASQYVKSFSDHSYPQSACSGSSTDLESLMTHSNIVDYTVKYKGDADAAHDIGKTFVLGETNSATCGGGGISPTFGAGLWIIDYIMQALLNHEPLGTVGPPPPILSHAPNSRWTSDNLLGQYCWWGKYDMGAPFYGAYFVASALAGADKVVQLDDGATDYAVYAVYESGSPLRAVLYNSEYYTSGTRSSTTFSLSNLGSSQSSVKAKRLTAPYATSRVDRGGNPSFGGQTFANVTCAIQGTETFETTTVTSGVATFTVGASEALLVYLA